MSKFTSCEQLIKFDVCFDIDGDIFIGEHGGVFTFSERSCEPVGVDFALFGDGDLSSSNLFNNFFDFAFVICGLTSLTLPSGLVRINSRRSSSDICLTPKLLA